MRTLVIVSLLGAAACASDPRYVVPREALEIGAPDSELAAATTSLVLPVRLEEEQEAEERAALAAALGVEVPYVTLEDFAVSIEWSIRNLSDQDGTARLVVNGANEYFAYVPDAFVVDPEEEEAPPPLLGDVPIAVPALSTVTGVLREDDVYEAAIDLELISRGGVNPFTALLRIDEELESIDAGGQALPLEAFASLVRFDLSFSADRHMVLEYAVRVRDERRPHRIHDEGLDAPAGELTAFAPADFAPMMEEMP